MRILVVSDTHGNAALLEKAIKAQQGAELVFHLGDGLDEFEQLKEKFPKIQFRGIQGNNDGIRFYDFPESNLEIIMGKRIFLAHGHRYGVKFGYDRILYAAAEKQADILLFGHTHSPLSTYQDGMHIVNPGNMSYRSGTYATIDLLGSKGIVTNIVKVKI